MTSRLKICVLPPSLALCAMWILAVNVGCPAVAQEPKPAAPAKEESWQVIYLSGQRIGFAHSVTETIKQDGRDVVRSSSDSHMTIKRFGQSLVMKQTVATEESTEGDLFTFRYEMANPPASSTSTAGKVEGKELKLEQTVNGKSKGSVQAWRPEVKSPTYQDRVLKSSPLKPGETRSFEAFMPEFSKVATVKLVAVDWEETALLDGQKKKLLKVKMTQSLIPGVVIVGFVDDKGETLKSSTSMLGVEMETYQVSKDEAFKAIDGTELDLAISTLVKVKRIPNAHETKKIVYLVTTLGQNPEDVLPSGGTQTVKKTDTEIGELTVTAAPIPDQATLQAVDDEFTAESQFLQRDDELVQAHAKKATGDATDPAQIARRMEKYVQKTLTKKDFSTAMASAGEVAKTLQGDCTEHAVLLAAMLRAKGIPSRVAVGLVYVDLKDTSAFGGHMWTEANLNGRWIPLDATLGRGGTGAAHIKLSDSSLSDDGPAAISSFAPLMLVIGQLKIDVKSVE
ncbi:MAG: transglutaminase domain-containing protein [Candidatus Saccharimonas sp.]|nr:transglutaminase domain-containing protein [Planctomycetaceae bacterium]